MNKTLVALIGLLIASALSWAVWVTNGLYGADKEKEVTSQKVTSVCEDMDEIKGDIRALKEEVKHQNEKMNSNQERILEKLIELNKNIKK